MARSRIISGDQLDVAAPAPAAAAPMPVVGDPGHVTEVVGLVVRAEIPGIALGELVQIDRRGGAPLAAEVVGFRGDEALLLPLGHLADVEPRARVTRTGAPLAIACGDALVGRVLDGLGHPIDGRELVAEETWAVDRPAPPPLERPRIT